MLEFLREHPGYEVTTCPEATGLNVTSTLRGLGIEIEWPPTKWALQVALAGMPSASGGEEGRR